MALPMAVPIPVIVRNEPLLKSVLIVTLLLFPGVKLAEPDATNDCPAGIKAPPFKEESPATSRVDKRLVNPLTERVLLKVAAPPTPKVPVMEVLPVKASTVNLLVLTDKFPIAFKFPPMVADPETPKLSLRKVSPATLSVELKVVAPITPRVDERFVAPLTVKFPPTVADPATPKLLFR